MDPTLKVTIIGTGNVATHFARALSGKVDICQIYGRNLARAHRIAQECNARAIDDFSCLKDADVYIVAINDDSIPDIAALRCDTDGIWVHTSGSVPANVWENKRKRHGVLYPLQTLSKDVPVDFKQIPLFIEGDSPETENKIKNLAELISDNVHHADSQLRRQLHIAAVFACNFSCYMWQIADELLHKENLDISVLFPLIQETLRKVIQTSPEEAMTGPARRGDQNVIKSHILSLDGDAKGLYKFISHQILNRYE